MKSGIPHGMGEGSHRRVWADGASAYDDSGSACKRAASFASRILKTMSDERLCVRPYLRPYMRPYVTE